MDKEITGIEFIQNALRIINEGYAPKIECKDISVYRVGKIIRIDIKGGELNGNS